MSTVDTADRTSNAMALIRSDCESFAISAGLGKPLPDEMISVCPFCLSLSMFFDGSFAVHRALPGAPHMLTIPLV